MSLEKIANCFLKLALVSRAVGNERPIK